MDIDTLLAYGATALGCGMVRHRLDVATVQQLGDYVHGYRDAKARHRSRRYGFHTYLDCEQVGPRSAEKLLEAYERWEQAVLVQRHVQNEPHEMMV